MIYKCPNCGESFDYEIDKLCPACNQLAELLKEIETKNIKKRLTGQITFLILNIILWLVGGFFFYYLVAAGPISDSLENAKNAGESIGLAIALTIILGIGLVALLILLVPAVIFFVVNLIKLIAKNPLNNRKLVLTNVILSSAFLLFDILTIVLCIAINKAK